MPDSPAVADGVDHAHAELIAADPFCSFVGIELIAVEPGAAETALTVTADHLNFHGVAHGGIVYTLADAAFAAASNAHGPTALALETNTSYLEAIEEGTALRATATETHWTERTAEYEVVVTDGGGDGDRVASFRGRVYRPDGN